MKKQAKTKTQSLPGKDTLRQYRYKCHRKSCGIIIPCYGWDSELQKTTVECTCGATLTAKNVLPEIKVQAPGIRTPTKNR